MSSAPTCSTAIWANDELHERARITNSVPPQLLPPKLDMALVVSGGRYSVTDGYSGESRVTVPLERPAVAVTTLNVDPGK